jgi:hypothetical protein
MKDHGYIGERPNLYHEADRLRKAHSIFREAYRGHLGIL